MQTSTIARTLMAAGSAGLALALGCSPSQSTRLEDPPVDPTAVGTAEPTETPTATPTGEVTATPTGEVTATTTATATVTAAIPDGCKPEPYCRPKRTPPESSGTGPPPDPNAPDLTVYDKDGCVSAQGVGNTCNGIRAINGPTVKGNQCCYDVCRFPVPCGRPLVVDGAPRLPTHGERAAPADPIAAAWLADAAMERASVASFAALALSLLSLGAPARLVEGAHRAALDEVAHAELCYGLAADRGARRSAGAIDLADLRITMDLAELAAETVRDGCVGETVAALSATHALRACTDERARAVIARVAEDELAHAELAFRVVGWAIAVGGAAVATRVERAIDEALAAMDRLGAPHAGPRRAWREAGRLDAGDLAGVTARARDEVLGPAFAHLRDASGAAAAVRA